MAQSCYVCGGYLYRGVRHRTCEPAYRRARIKPCSICGGMSRGEKHRLCGTRPKGYQPCGYCGATTRGKYHKECSPLRAEFSVFRDLPDVVQRRCVSCQEWFPFAGPDVDPADAWSPHGRSHSGRKLFAGRCRACLAERRRTGIKGGGVPIEDDAAGKIAQLLKAGWKKAEIARELGISVRTIYRYIPEEKAA